MNDTNVTHFPFVEISQIAEKESWRKEINRPIYHIHKWWAQRLGTIFRTIAIYLANTQSDSVSDDFYKIHNLQDKIILDPFMGSGTTIGESIKLGAKAVGCDINPISTFLVTQELTHVSIEELWREYESLKNKVANQIQYYYKTIDPETGMEIPVLYYYWVKMVETPDGEKIPLFNRYVFAQNAYPSKKPESSIVCPHCWNVFRGMYNSTDEECPKCHNHFNPQNGPAGRNHVLSSKGKKYNLRDLVDGEKPLEEKLYATLAVNRAGKKVYLPITDYDISLYNKAVEELNNRADIFIPNYTVKSGFNTNQAISYGYHKWSDFFNQRQLLCLGMLLNGITSIKNKSIQEQLLCLFSSTLEFNNMFCSFKGEGTGAVRPLFSNHILKPERTPLENSVWGTKGSSGCFSTLFESKLLPAKVYLDNPFEIKIDGSSNSGKVLSSKTINPTICNQWNDFVNADNPVLILNGDSSHLPIPDCSVDFVITDPPYFDFIHYSELSDFFYAWLSPLLKDRYTYFSPDSSRRENEVQQVDSTLFSQLLGNVFIEAYRVSKPNGKLAFSFHHSRIDGWLAIANAIKQSGFFVNETIPVHAELMASTPKASAKEPISLDAIIICSKHNVHLEKSNAIEIAKTFAVKYLESGKKLSKSDLFVICASVSLPFIVNDGYSDNQYEELVNMTNTSVSDFIRESKQ